MNYKCSYCNKTFRERDLLGFILPVISEDKKHVERKPVNLCTSCATKFAFSEGFTSVFDFRV